MLIEVCVIRLCFNFLFWLQCLHNLSLETMLNHDRGSRCEAGATKNKGLRSGETKNQPYGCRIIEVFEPFCKKRHLQVNLNRYEDCCIYQVGYMVMKSKVVAKV